MAKLVSPAPKTDPLVRWEVREYPSRGEFRPNPPSVPQGYEDGYWSLSEVVPLPASSSVALKWKFCPGPNDRDRHMYMERAVMDLYNAVQSVFCQREEPLTTRGGHPIEPPDTSGDLWLWDSLYKWAQALRGDGQSR